MQKPKRLGSNDLSRFFILIKWEIITNYIHFKGVF